MPAQEDWTSPAPVVDVTARSLERALAACQSTLSVLEIGVVDYVGAGIARLRGLPGVRSEELIRFPGGTLGMAFNVDEEEVGVVLLGASASLAAGDEARRTGRVLDVPVGSGVLGRILDPLGTALDGREALRATERRPAEREAPAIISRAPVTVPLQTGLKSVDALIPIGRGQRELILGDRQTGKTAVALDTIINQKNTGVICVYCAIGQRRSATAKLVDELRVRGAMEYTVLVVAEGDAPPGLQFVAPYAATTMAEYFVEQGRDVLIVYDDLTRHAVAYREVSLLLRRPPGREAFPGDIFYVHSRLLERATHYRPEHGGGSLTALPVAETEAQNIAGYIPTNLISITDGQIYLSPDLFQKGVLPAIDIGRSVSRVGGKTQLSAYRAVAGALRLAYAQFEELESFARFGTRLDETARRTIERGRRVREILKQPQYQPMRVAEQIASLLAVTEGLFDDVPTGAVPDVDTRLRHAVRATCGAVCERLEEGGALTEDDRQSLLAAMRKALTRNDEHGHA